MTTAKYMVTVFAFILLFSAIFAPFAASQEWTPSREITIHQEISDANTKYHNYALAWSHNGKYLAFISVSETDLNVINTETGKPIFSKNYSMSPNPTVIEFSPHDRYLAVGSLSMLEIIDVRTWSTIKNYNESVCSLSWSPDGRYLAYAFSSVKIMDTMGWNVIRNLSVNATEMEIKWSPNGDYLAYTSVSYVGIITVSVWNTTTKLPLISHFAKSECIEWSPDSGYLVAGEVILGDAYSGVPDKGALQIWSTGSWVLKNNVYFGNETIPFSLSWNPHMPILAVGLDSGFFTGNAMPELSLLDTDNWTICGTLEPIDKTVLSSVKKDLYWSQFYSVAWSPDGNSLAVAYKDVFVYTTEKGLFEDETETATSYNLFWPSIGIGTIMAVVVAALWYVRKRSKKENLELNEAKPDDNE